MNGDNLRYFHSFGVECISKEIEKFIGNKNITTNIYKTKAYDSVRSEYFCIGFFYFMLNNKRFAQGLSKIPLLVDILFERYKMNKIVNKFLSVGDKPEIHLKQPLSMYSASGPLPKNKEKIKKSKEIFIKMY